MERLALFWVPVSGACVIAFVPLSTGRAGGESQPILGIEMPEGYRDWRLISVAHEAGKVDDLRAVLGNDLAIECIPGRQGGISGWRDHRAPGLGLHALGREQQGLTYLESKLDAAPADVKGSIEPAFANDKYNLIF